ncbi:ABC transporter substrate-binding protein [Microbacterium sp. AGC62]|uniref:ABC transporter substrate-binding protein n=1 Tax=Microbacterium TaxID=33882 RepID=UPI000B8921F2|nr:MULTISPECIES: sugar ABC transporter substrate-binding protein [Microbacterium]MBT2496334.1 sugar ABC transporter substrate-binding protein [Microbacterium sp. ISL-59]PRB59956.1 sugar ABC transporter substrate-binding protein [Microbacterium sp. MYb45]
MKSNHAHPSRRARALRITGLVAAATIALAGCAAGDDSSDAGSAGGELTFSNWQFLEDGKGPIIWDAVKGYTGPDDNIELTKVEIPFANYADKLSTELGAGGGPDVMVLQDSQFASLVDAGVLEPLDDIADELGDTLNNTNEAGVFDGGQYGFNWERPTYSTVIYNKDIFAELGLEVPTTFDEFLTTAKTIKDELGISGWAGRHQTAEIDGWTLEMANWIYGFGGELSDGKKLTIDKAENVEAVEAFLETFASGVAPIGDDASTFRAKFGQGQVGMLFENSGVATTITSNPDNAVNGQNMGAAPLPLANPGSNSQLIIAVNANSDNKEAAKDFVRWVLGEEGQTAIRAGLGASAMATDVEPDAAFLEANPWATQFLEAAKTSKSTLVEGFETESKVVWREVLTAVEDLRVNGGDVKAKLAEVQENLEAELG